MAGLSPDGVLVVDKPTGPTSHDIVAQARRLYRTKSVGHAGTLDPMASGVLVLMFGEATKLSNYITAQTESYSAEICFGRSTDSLDALGTTLEEQPLPSGWPPHAELAAALAAELARSLQVPPQVSAIKLAGRPAHERVRAGETLDLAERPVQVQSLELLEIAGAYARFNLSVSKGYYVRALARDLGERLGVPAHLSRLRRTRSGAWSLSDAAAWPPAEPRALLATADAARACLPVGLLTADGATRSRQGKPLGESEFIQLPPEASVGAWFDPEQRLVALGHSIEPGVYRVVRGFREN